MITSLGLIVYNKWPGNLAIRLNEKSLLPEVETFDSGSFTIYYQKLYGHFNSSELFIQFLLLCFFFKQGSFQFIKFYKIIGR